MSFLPIVERELRVRARQTATFRIRIGAALLAGLVAAFFLLTSQGWFTPGKVGRVMFWVLSTLAFLWCLVEGPRNTSDALSEEKRAGTLGLLFLTDLKTYDVVLGKFISNSLNSFYGVLAVLPMIGLPLLLGGVTPGEFWRMVLTLMAVLAFSLSAGMLISAACRDERRAWFGTVALVGFLVVIGSAFRWLPHTSAQFLAWSSPGMAFLSLGDATFSARPGPYLSSIGGAFLWTVGFLIAACFILPHAWQDKPLRPAGTARVPTLRPRRTPDARRMMYANPVVWLLSSGRQREFFVWLLVGCAIGPAFIALILWPDGFFKTPLALIGGIILHLLLPIWVAVEACFTISDARANGALDLLLTTPLSPGAIIDGHIKTIQKQFLAPVVTLSICEIAILLNYAFSDDVNGLAFTVGIFAIASFLFDMYAAAWFGSWMGLVNKKSAHAVLKTVVYLFILPLPFMLCWTFLFPIGVVLKDTIFINYAQGNLRRHFRVAVTEGWPPRTRPARPLPPKLPNVLDR